MTFELSKVKEQEIYQLLKDKYDLLRKKNFNLASKKLFTNLEKRYQEAKKKKINMLTFFEAENEAYDNFKEMLIKKGVELNDSSDLDDDKAGGKGAIEGIFERVNQNISNYDRVTIHHNASEEIERLLGCLLQFKKDFMPGLNKLKTLTKEIENNNNFIEAMKLLRSLSSVEKSESLPSAFNAFKLSLEIYEKNHIENEKSHMEVFKQVIFLFKKLKQFCLFIEQIIFRSTSFKLKKIPYLDKELFIDEYGLLLTKKINTILKDFRLDEFY